MKKIAMLLVWGVIYSKSNMNILVVVNDTLDYRVKRERSLGQFCFWYLLSDIHEMMHEHHLTILYNNIFNS